MSTMLVFDVSNLFLDSVCFKWRAHSNSLQPTPRAGRFVIDYSGCGFLKASDGWSGAAELKAVSLLEFGIDFEVRKSRLEHISSNLRF
jgi:hypothetical protein